MRVGIDLGGTKIMGVLVDDRGELVDRHKQPTPRQGIDAVVDAVADVVTTVAGGHPFRTVGIGVPGPVPPGSGIVQTLVNIDGWEKPVPLGPMLEDRLGTPVVVDNDVNVATLAEHRLGAGRGIDDFLGLFLGTGVGGALVLDGRLRRGPRGLAGEVGHSIVNFGAIADGLATAESYVGRRALEERARSRHAAGAESPFFDEVDDRPIKSKRWLRARDDGDPLVNELLDEAEVAVASLITSVLLTVDIERVVIGGGMGDRLGAPFRAAVARRVEALTFTEAPVDIVGVELDDVAGACGAALLEVEE